MKLAINTFKIKLFNMLMSFASAIQAIPAKITPPPFRLMQIGSLFWQSRALYGATKLGLADVIGDTEKTTAEIAKPSNTPPITLSLIGATELANSSEKTLSLRARIIDRVVCYASNEMQHWEFKQEFESFKSNLLSEFDIE